MMNYSLSPDITKLILSYGKEILDSPGMEYEKTQKQHGRISCFEHSTAVAYVSVWLAVSMGINIDNRSLIRGALLHDYFLYDWHDYDKSHRLHGFVHARIALTNASRDFCLNDIEKDIIARHMFPLNITPPKYVESGIVCLADKLCAGLEVVSAVFPVPSPAVSIGRQL